MPVPNGIKLAYLNSLLPPDPSWPGTGAVELPPDSRDWPVTSIPEVNALLAAGVPDSATQVQWITGPPDDQDGTGACVAASYCNLGSMYSQLEQGRWEIYDWLQLYHEAGGHGQDGVDSRTAAKIATDQGLPYNGGRRKLFSSYTFVQQTPGVFRQQLKAAIASGQLCKLALLLPAPFQWNSGDAPTSGYHEVVAFGYDPIWVYIFNSWGPGWPGDAPTGTPPGIGRVKWDYVEADGLQHNYCYSFVIVPLGGGTPPPPPPPPPVGRTVSGPTQGTAQGPGSNLLAVGQQISVSGGSFTGTMTIAQIDDNPIPPPSQLSVTGYSPASVMPGQSFQILGQGFATPGNLTVTWGGLTLIANRVSDTVIQASAPVSQSGTNTVTVQIGGAVATGPLLLVGDGGPPPGDLVVVLTHVGALLRAEVHDSSGQRLSAFCTAVVGGVNKGQSNTSPTKYAVWLVQGFPAGTPAVVTATDTQGRTGTGTLTL